MNFKDLYLQRQASNVQKLRLSAGNFGQGSVVMKNAFNTKIFACKRCPFGPTESLADFSSHVEESSEHSSKTTNRDGPGCLQCCECKDGRSFESLSEVVKHVERYHA